MLRKILSVIGAIALVVLVYLMFSFGGMMSKVSSLHPDAIHYYMEMFEKVLETGNSAEAMVRKVKINDDISNDDVVEAMQSIAEENNFLVVGDSKMSISSSIKTKQA